MFTDAPKAHIDLAPDDVGRACDSWQGAARKLTRASQPEADSWSGAASTSGPIAGDGQFHTCSFEVGKNDHWAGCITSLRFDPTSGPGVIIEIRTIRLE